ncbi:hypothetical protein [Yoonia sp. 2307UL14-13]|uniref:hypothetical protein n=1 Tax=Yoonia sp. 2307UL14-13 TaxID=3126506 RepID=UPI00309F2694
MSDQNMSFIDKVQNVGIIIGIVGTVFSASWTYAVHRRAECVQGEIPKAILEISRSDALIDNVSQTVLNLEKSMTSETLAIAMLLRENPDQRESPTQIANMIAALSAAQKELRSAVDKSGSDDTDLADAIRLFDGSIAGSACDLSDLNTAPQRLQACPAAIRQSAEEMITVFKGQRDEQAARLGTFERCEGRFLGYIF